MTHYTLGGGPDDKDHAVYDSETGTLTRHNGRPHWREISGDFQELATDDFWGGFRQENDQHVFFHNEKMYPDDPDRLVVWVDILGPSQARLHYVWDGAIVEKVVYRRVTGVGVNVYDSFEEDLDTFLYWSKKHENRRLKWPKIFPVKI